MASRSRSARRTGIENFASRQKILALTTLRLRCVTSVRQLTPILDDVRALVVRSPKIEQASSRIRLIDFGERALEVELLAYVLTADFGDFLGLRERLLLEIASILEAAGSAFAQPTEFIFMDGKSPSDTAVARGIRRDSAIADDVRLTPGVR